MKNLILLLPLAFSAWFFIPTSFFLEPKDMAFQEETGSLTYVIESSTQSPASRILYIENQFNEEVCEWGYVTIINEGAQSYQTVLPPEVASCFEEGSVIIQDTYRIYLFGWLPLASSTFIFTTLE